MGKELLQDRTGSAYSIVSWRLLVTSTVLVCGISMLGIFAWVSGQTFLASLGPGEVPMAPSTALAFLVFSAGLLSYPGSRVTGTLRWISRISSVVILLTGILFLVTNIAGLRYQWEHFYIRIPVSALSFDIGHMSVVTSLLFLISGLTLLMMHFAGKKWQNIIQLLIFVVFTASALFLLGYGFRTPFFYSGKFIPPASLTLLSFLLASLALLAGSNRNTFLVSWVMKNSTRAKLLRIFLPFITLLSVLESLIIARVLPLTGINPAIGVALVVIIFIALIIVVVPLIAKEFGRSLDVAIEELRVSEQEFRLLAEAMPQIVWVTRADGWNIYFNQQWVDYTGLSLEESYGHGWNKPFHPDDQQRAWLAWQNAVTTHGEYSIQARLRRKDGIYHWWLIRGVPVQDENGEISKWFGTCTDISEQKNAETEIKKLNEELEKRVLDRTAQLEVAVRELEAFSYSVSHDLRAPVRAMNGFAQILLDDYAPLFDDEVKRLLNTIAGNARKMGVLIDDLLAFSRVGRQEIQRTGIDMSGMAESVFREMVQELQNSGIEFILHDIPPAYGDASLVRQVWVNLVGNAVKFTTYKAHRVIEIGSEPGEGMNSYYVRDNGAGFDMKYAHKLFGVFERLHDLKEFDGTGVGLAIVQRIIHKLGGQVRAEGKPGEGATFYFTLPKK